ncbi:MAG: hypothetical protein KF845_11535 [Cyclobacteriaceae bacterium]|nr:hypothetical protein [Cyclobacteriaceae bacterium]
MKNVFFTAVILMVVSAPAFAQDEGSAVAKARFERDKSVYLGVGASFVFGDNIGDYGVGANFEIGFMKRLNKLISVGGGFSYLGFDYDPSVSESYNGGKGNNIFFNNSDDLARVVFLEGGDLSLLSLSVNIKLNLIPVSDNTKISVYGFAKPMITSISRSAVSGVGELWYYDYQLGNWFNDPDYDDIWDSNTPGLEGLGGETAITGGILMGPGIELFPSKRFSFFTQVAIGYTFPIQYVSTAAYPPTIDSYQDEKFPLTKSGFPSLSIQFGMSINF